ncbi:MAG: oligosaccharide flippase family protein [Pseudomonadales bacterium]|nr:oligosaccharide flippase family protein [Pseudomonadales bacterium]
MRAIQRSLGLISIVFLARLLEPADFGVIAVISVVIAFVEILGDTGSRQYIAQLGTIDRGHVDTAWTLDLVLKLALWSLLLVAAPLVSQYFESKDLVDALRSISVVVPIKALFNPGLHLARRNLDYSPILKLHTIQRLVSFACSITLALLLQSYWALIIAHVVANLVGLFGSYVVNDFRPRLSLKRVGEQWSFSKWMLSKGFLGFARAQIDTVLVGRLFGLELLGKYEVIRDVSTLPAVDVITPAVDPMVASLSRLRSDRVGMRNQFCLALVMICAFVTPILVYISVRSPQIVGVILGQKFSGHGHLMSAMPALLLSFAFNGLLASTLLALQRVRALFVYDALSLAFVLGTLLLLNPQDLFAFASARGASGLFAALILLLILCRNLGIGLMAVVRILAVPSLVAGPIMLALTFVHEPVTTSLVALLAEGCGFSLAYVALLFGIAHGGRRWVPELYKVGELLIALLSRGLKQGR